MSDAFELAFMDALDDLNDGRLHRDLGHYLRTVPAARREEFVQRLSCRVAAYGPSARDMVSGTHKAAREVVATLTASTDPAGILGRDPA